ncbi:unnamed protein product [Sphagnum jensenii]|uniref:2-C-methyl-D-erythritol 4-phosphate cytidylyltransferase n=1 Tax=Sphagnum jensenii TaxID=128206 RepID=A0ABP1B2C8_9BRYO
MKFKFCNRLTTHLPFVCGRQTFPIGQLRKLTAATRTRAGWARADCVRTSRVPTSFEYKTRSGAREGSRNFKLLAMRAPQNTASEPSVSVILLAGGKGKRMGANMPKQYLPLLGQPIALHSFHTFAKMEEIMEIVVVCDPSYRDIFEDAAKTISIPLKFALPGKERQDSVYSGLQEINKLAKLACVHDSARPLVLPKDISKVIKDATAHGAAVLGVPVKATIKEAGDDLFVTRTLDRQLLWEIQTPQVIEPGLLARGFELVKREGFEVTDDVSIVEYLKHPVFITHGSYANLKVTTPDDMLVAERILSQTATTDAEKAVASTI